MAYQTIHTNYGLQRLASAESSGTPINLTTFVLGDGAGLPANPSPTQTSLVNQVWTAPITLLEAVPVDSSRLYVEVTVPASDGGWTIREFGIKDDQGGLFCVGNFPTTYKSTVSDGATNDLVIRVVIAVSNAAVINLILDPAVAIATRAWVVNNIDTSALIPGGTTGQVLRKHSNLDGDTEWADPSSATILVDAIEETQTLSSGQQTVNLTTVNTTGLAVYVEGVRIPKQAGIDGWQQGTSSTQIVLGKSYPAGHRVTCVQNDPASHVPDPLARSNNLSDLENTATARTNLGVYSKTEADLIYPAGFYGYSAGSSVPAGWLIANGAVVSRTTYAALFGAIGTAYNTGNELSTQFRLPDLRGTFLRGLDLGRGLDSGRTLGTYQSDALQNITGSFGISSSDTVTLAGATGAFANNGPASSQWGADAKPPEAGITFDASRVARTATETRPKNISAMPLIKY